MPPLSVDALRRQYKSGALLPVYVLVGSDTASAAAEGPFENARTITLPSFTNASTPPLAFEATATGASALSTVAMAAAESPGGPSSVRSSTCDFAAFPTGGFDFVGALAHATSRQSAAGAAMEKRAIGRGP